MGDSSVSCHLTATSGGVVCSQLGRLGLSGSLAETQSARHPLTHGGGRAMEAPGRWFGVWSPGASWGLITERDGGSRWEAGEW